MAIGDRGVPGLVALRLVTLELQQGLEIVMTLLRLGWELIVLETLKKHQFASKNLALVS